MLIFEERQSPLPWVSSYNSDIDHRTYESHRKRIETEVGRFEFGAGVAEISQRYAFVSREDTEAFFENMRAANPKLFGEVDSPQKFSSHVVNLQDGGGPGTSPMPSSGIFEKRAERLAKVIQTQSSSYFRVIVGPVGSGKTAFSKGLFTAGLKEFWKQNIIPSRIEWRHSKSVSLASYIVRCASRDLSIYVISELQDEDFEKFVAECSNQTGKELRKIRAWYFSHSVRDDERWLRLLSDSVNLAEFLSKTPRCSELNRAGIMALGVRFIFSFDGFDAISSVEAFTPKQLPEPVVRLKNFLVNGIIDSKHGEMFFQNGNAHFLLYVRDTTLRIIEGELKHHRLNRNNVEHRWICPPSYRSVAAIMVRRLRKAEAHEPTTRRDSSFVNGLVSQVRNEVDSAFDGGIRRPISAAFGWNVRNMKRHIGRLLILMLNKLTLGNPDFCQKIKAAGVGSYVFSDLIDERHTVSIQKYEIERSLVFQEHTGEVGARFNVDEESLYDLCFEKRFDDNILERISRFSDDGSIGDCIFNQFFDDTYPIDEETFSIAPMLVLSRLYHSDRGFCEGVRLEKITMECGILREHEQSRKVVEFLLGWMTTVGLINTTVHTKGKSPIRSQFCITPTGLFLLKRGAFTVSYLDSACFSSFWPEKWRDSISFHHARDSVEESIVAAVKNACELALHLMETEELAKSRLLVSNKSLYTRNKNVFGSVALAAPHLVRECQKILDSAAPSVRKRPIMGQAKESLKSIEREL